MPVSRKPRDEPRPSASPKKRAKVARAEREEAQRTIRVASSAPSTQVAATAPIGSKRKRRDAEVEEEDGDDDSFDYTRPQKKRREELDDEPAGEVREKRKKRQKKNKGKKHEQVMQEVEEEEQQRNQSEPEERQEDDFMSRKRGKRQKTYKGRKGKRKAGDDHDRLQSSPSGQLLFEASQQPVEAMHVIDESEQEEVSGSPGLVPEEVEESEQDEEVEEEEEAEEEKEEEQQEEEEEERKGAGQLDQEDVDESDEDEMQAHRQEEFQESDQEEVKESEQEEATISSSDEESNDQGAAVPSTNGTYFSPRQKRSGGRGSTSEDEIPTSAQKTSTRVRKRAPKQSSRVDKKTRPSRPEISESDSSNGEDDDASDLPSTGPFSAKETKIMSRFVKNFIKDNGMTQDTFNEIVQDRKTSEGSKKIWNELVQRLPHRNRKALQRGMRVRYHNSGARGKWTEDDDEKLREAYKVKPQKWTYIGGVVGRLPEDCKDRWRNLLAYGDNRRTYRWNAEEEQALRAAVAECIDLLREAAQAESVNGRKPSAEEIGMDNISWSAVSDRMNKTRSRLQCYTKWQNLTKAG